MVKFSATFDDQMLVDYWKNGITEETLAIYKISKIAIWRARLSRCSLARINRTENPPAVLHVALRNRSNTRFWLMAKT
ncbi:hypothetical protein ACLB1E_03130 [Escherichia coli]